MYHNYLPRLRRVVLPALLTLAGTFGCEDSTSPRDALTVDLDDAGASADSVGRLGLGLRAARRDSAALSELRVTVRGSDGAVVDTATTLAFVARYSGSSVTTRVLGAVVSFPGSGRFTIDVALRDTAGRVLATSFSRTVHVVTVPYVVTPLPDDGRGAGVRWITADGSISGWVVDATGHQRPAVWRRGTLTHVAVPDTGNVVAVRLNRAGDVLLQVTYPHPPIPRDVVDTATGAIVLRADGTRIRIGPQMIARPGEDPTVTCCRVAADLTEDRRALGTSAYPNWLNGYGASAAIIDVASGLRTDSVAGRVDRLNARGHLMRQQIVGTDGHSPPTLAVSGFTVPELPDGAPLHPDCGYSPSHSTFLIAGIDLSDTDELLVEHCGSPAWLSATRRVWLDRQLGRVGDVRLAREGDLVAGLDSAGAIHLWRASTNRAVTIRPTAGSWRFTGLAAVNGAGQIAASAVDPVEGRTVALLLTPAP